MLAEFRKRFFLTALLFGVLGLPAVLLVSWLTDASVTSQAWIWVLVVIGIFTFGALIDVLLVIQAEESRFRFEVLWEYRDRVRFDFEDRLGEYKQKSSSFRERYSELSEEERHVLARLHPSNALLKQAIDTVERTWRVGAEDRQVWDLAELRRACFGSFERVDSL
jgi:hypothetical protein